MKIARFRSPWAKYFYRIFRFCSCSVNCLQNVVFSLFSVWFFFCFAQYSYFFLFWSLIGLLLLFSCLNVTNSFQLDFKNRTTFNSNHFQKGTNESKYFYGETLWQRWSTEQPKNAFVGWHILPVVNEHHSFAFDELTFAFSLLFVFVSHSLKSQIVHLLPK